MAKMDPRCILSYILFVTLFMCFVRLVLAIEGFHVNPIGIINLKNLSIDKRWPIDIEFRPVDIFLSNDTLLGFYKVDNDQYELSIAWTLPNLGQRQEIGEFQVHSFEKVWSANRDMLVTSDAYLNVTDKNLDMFDGARKKVWSTNITSGIVYYKLQSGILTLYDANNEDVWSSCDSPTDTLLVQCSLKLHMSLTTMMSPRNHSKELYKLKMEEGGIGLYRLPISCHQPRPFWKVSIPKYPSNYISIEVQDDLVALKVVSNEYLRENNILEITLHFDILIFLKLEYDGSLQWHFIAIHISSGLSNGWSSIPIDLSQGCEYQKCAKIPSCDYRDPKLPFLCTPGGIATTIGSGFFMGIIVCILGGLFYKWQRSKTNVSLQSRDDDDEAFLLTLSGLPPRFSSEELSVATNNFCEVLGIGGFGIVFKGALSNGTIVAVKKMKDSRLGKKEFEVEIATLGTIHHHSLIRLYGFCIEHHDRMLVYEFMASGTLNECLFGEQYLDWSIRFQIALDIADGLHYLHNCCTKKIIHFDVKPQNILLDKEYRAKLADFGMAKICEKDKSQIDTMMRGTIGYLAPEWRLHPTVTDKCDVYSYGMVLLEIVSGRKKSYDNEELDDWYFPSFAVKQLQQDKGCKNLVDIRMHDKFMVDGWDQVNNAIKIAFWCLQDDPKIRPSMEKVVHMLKGVVEVTDPPLEFDFLSVIG